MKLRLLVICLLVLALLSGCSSNPPINGTVVRGYIETLNATTLVVDGNSYPVSAVQKWNRDGHLGTIDDFAVGDYVEVTEDFEPQPGKTDPDVWVRSYPEPQG
jgi:hypothetical protein